MTRSTGTLSSVSTRSRPPAYVVGTQRAQQPLVSAEQVKGHIRLLRAFYNLRITVEDCKDRRIPWYVMQMDQDSRWRWFVHLAVERFERWAKSLQFVPLEKFVTEQLPPLDVWMVWHAYLLSPCRYAEDCERLEILQQLQLLNVFVVGSIDIGKVVQHKPSSARAEAWFKQTGTPFNPFEAMGVTENRFKPLQCPRCRTMVYAPFVNENGTGFAEENFSVTCPLPGCTLKITHENLAVAKFVRDLSECDVAQEHFVAGSLYTPSGKRDARHAKLIRDQLLRSAHFAGLGPSTDNGRLARLDRVTEIKENIGYSLERLKEAITTSLRNCPATSATRVLSAYTDGSPFSVHLVDAVIRQCNFTDRLDELAWLKAGTFRPIDKHEILEHSIMRYHAFLDLISAHPNSSFIPTLDIDLVWHTHQLLANRYNVDCEMYVGHHLDHESNVTDSRLSSAFENTCRAWQMRFQDSYMQCGCPVTEGTVARKFIRLVRSYFWGRSQPQVSLHPDHLLATHPSVHNATFTFQNAGTGTFCKMYHYDKRKEEESQSTMERPTRKMFKHTTRFDSEWTLSMHSPALPAYFDSRELPPVPKLG